MLKINLKNLKDKELRVQKSFRLAVNLEIIVIKIKMKKINLIMENIKSMRIHKTQDLKILKFQIKTKKIKKQMNWKMKIKIG